MQILTTYKLDPFKIKYKHSNKLVNKRVKQLFSVLDEIILGKTINDLHILTHKELLDTDYFNNELYLVNNSYDAFIKYQSLFYILIKSKYFHLSNTIDYDNNIFIFITKSIVHYIGEDWKKYMKIIKTLPISDLFDSSFTQIWEKFDERIMHFIIIKGMIPFILFPSFDYRKICSLCGKISNVTFIRCIGCKVTNYCSNTCQFYDLKNHKKYCISIYE